MTALTNKTSTKRRLLLASDRSDQSSELAGILQSVSEVDTIATSEIPDAPERDLSGIVVDINLRSPESVQLVRNKLRGRGLSRDAAAVRAGGRAASRLDAGLGARRHRHDRAAVRRAGHPAAHPRRVSRRQFLRRDRSRQGAEPRRRGGARRHGQDLREAAGRRAAEIQRHRRGRKQDPQGDQAFLAAGMADDGRLPPHRQLSPLPVRHRLCGGVRPASRHARGRPAPARPRRAAARCRQGVRSGRDPRQARPH